MTRLAYLFALAACSDFSTIERGVCGNGIVEPGEDCDSNDPSCVRCAVTCTMASDCPTSDYACGADGLCHAPAGQLASPTAPVSFAADDIRITDLDHDGIGDLVGASKTSLVVRFGDAAGGLARLDSIVTPAQTGPAAFGDLDGDGSIDVTVSARDGLVSYTSPFGAPSPVDIESPIYDAMGQPLDIASLFPIGSLQLGVLFVVDGQIIIAAVDFLNASAPYVAFPCASRLGAITRAQLDARSIDVYRASAIGAATADVVMSFQTTTGGVCVTAVHGSSLTGFTLTDITPVGAAPSQRPILADLDGDSDPCPGLVDSDGGPTALATWAGHMGAGHCTLAATKTALPAIANTAADAVAIGRMPVSPPLAGFATDALVMTTGVYVAAPGSALLAAYTSTRKLDRVAFGDIDGDGDIDAVLSAEGEDDLDVLLRFPLGLELLRLDTENPITTLTVADLDGNGVDDIAYTERVGDHQRMSIAYGTGDQPLPPIQVATFSDVASVVPLAFPDTEDQLDIAADLAVLQPATGTTPTMSLLHGSPQRTMLSYLDPRGDTAAALRGSVVGAFSGDGHADVVAFGSTATQTVAWRIAGTASGLDTTPVTATPMTGLGDCGGSGVCLDDALYLAFPGTDHDAIIAIDRAEAPHAVMIDPTSLVATPATALAAAAPVGTAPQSMHVVTFGDDTELVASFTNATGDFGAVVACTVDAGMPSRCTDLAGTIRTVAPVTACIDAAPGRIGPSTGLVVLCSDPAGSALYTVTRDADGFHASALGRGTNLHGIRVGDVTGDGVDDVIGIAGDQVVVFAQCTTRNLDSCRVTDV
ncbi:MAG TPA: VCBS repeat-containing protein, partial [Kofleriaceae bacterium]|nr:VCBS repeat-containing protein [Kofleriaceae bacterium]